MITFFDGIYVHHRWINSGGAFCCLDMSFIQYGFFRTFA